MPYLLPIAAGLCFNAFAMIPAAFGVIIFYIIKTASEYETALTTKSVNDSMQQISYIVESLFNNKEMIESYKTNQSDLMKYEKISGKLVTNLFLKRFSFFRTLQS